MSEEQKHAELHRRAQKAEGEVARLKKKIERLEESNAARQKQYDLAELSQRKWRQAAANEVSIALGLLADAQSLLRQAVHPAKTWSEASLRDFENRVYDLEFHVQEFLQDGAKR